MYVAIDFNLQIFIYTLFLPVTYMIVNCCAWIFYQAQQLVLICFSSSKEAWYQLLLPDSLLGSADWSSLRPMFCFHAIGGA